MKVYSKLAQVQSELNCPKKQFNKFGNFYYRNAEDILTALKPLLEKVGCSVVISDRIVFVEGRHYIESEVRFIDGETGEMVINSAFAREEETRKGMNVDQLTGATSSYARKYALNGMFLIDDNKDSDTTNTGEQGNAAKFESMWVGLNEEQKKWFENKYKKDYSKFTKKEKEEAYEILMKKKEK